MDRSGLGYLCTTIKTGIQVKQGAKVSFALDFRLLFEAIFILEYRTILCLKLIFLSLDQMFKTQLLIPAITNNRFVAKQQLLMLVHCMYETRFYAAFNASNILDKKTR
jgi:hypothetical protein